MTLTRLAAIIGALPNTLLNGTTADATQVMADLNWIVNQVNANAADATLVALKASNNNFTAVQSGIAATAAAHFPIASQVQNDNLRTFQSTLGTNSITARCAALALGAWTTDAVFSFIPSQTNTGPANITVDSAGSSIIFSMGSTLVGGELRAGVPAFVKRDATRLNLSNPANVRFDLASSANQTGIRIVVANTPFPFTIGKQPTRTVLTSGSATYTPPTGCTSINVRVLGGGAGGAGATANNGAAGNNTTFGTLTANGGTAGIANGVIGADGGAASGGDINIRGGSGLSGGVSATAGVAHPGGGGGNSAFGGGGTSAVNAAGGNGAANSGGGGAGGGGASGGNSGGGGGSGGYTEKLFTPPAASYSYSVGSTAAGGAAGTNAGGDGAAGIIIIDEYYG